MGGPVTALNYNSDKRIFIICNLLAGGGLAEGRWVKFLEEVTRVGYRIDYRITEGRDHATEIAHNEVEKGEERIAVFGGDGTLNEVLNGVIKNDSLINPDLKLIYLGAGSSCDVEKMFTKKKTLLERLISNEFYSVDVSRVECQNSSREKIVRYFLANSSIGIISRAVYLFNRKTKLMDFLKRVNIDLAALSQGVKALIEFGKMDCSIEVDGKKLPQKSLKNITIFKCPYFGGGMNYGKDTKYDDNLLHVATIDNVSRLRLFTLIPPLYTGTILRKKQSDYYQAQKVNIQILCEKAAVETDGEIVGLPPCSYSILPRFLKLIV